MGQHVMSGTIEFSISKLEASFIHWKIQKTNYVGDCTEILEWKDGRVHLGGAMRKYTS